MTARRTYPLRQAVNTVLLLALLCGLALAAGCTPAEEKQPRYAFTAEVRSLTGDTVCVSVLDPCAGALKAGQYIALSAKTLDNSSLEGISVGFRVTVVMADPIEDTAQPAVAYSIRLNDIQPR